MRAAAIFLSVLLGLTQALAALAPLHPAAKAACCGCQCGQRACCGGGQAPRPSGPTTQAAAVERAAAAPRTPAREPRLTPTPSISSVCLVRSSLPSSASSEAAAPPLFLRHRALLL